MQLNSMNLMGLFELPVEGHCYALTVICMLIGSTVCVPLETKTAT